MFGESNEGRETLLTFPAPKGRESQEAGREEAETTRKGPGKVINMKERASELRIQNTFTGSVQAMDAAAAAAIGDMFLKGDGVTPSPAKAAHFLALAAKGGITQSMHQLALLHLEGAHVPYDPNYARALLEGACAEEYFPAIVTLAEQYIFAQHWQRDTDKALELLYRLVFENEPSVFYYLAYIYDKFPEHRDPHEAAYWYRRAAEYGHYKSQIRLAALYATGLGVPRCHETAEAFLEVALESSSSQDPKLLCWQGERLAKLEDTEWLARALIKAAADRHYTPAQRLILQHKWSSR